jgi:hypothetical protein
MHSTPTPIVHHQPTQVKFLAQILKVYAKFSGPFAYGAELDIEKIQPGRAVTTLTANNPWNRTHPYPKISSNIKNVTGFHTHAAIIVAFRSCTHHSHLP